MTSQPKSLEERMTKVERDQNFSNQRPRDAATLILLDRTAEKPRILMGKRNANLKFMPNKFVFPGGRIDPADKLMPVYGALGSRYEEALMARVTRPTLSRTRALILTCIRETFEETGLMLGTKEMGTPEVNHASWLPFKEAGVFPDIENIHFIARAITPPRRPRRFDTRFFVCEASQIAHEVKDVVHEGAELTELKWLTLEEARYEDLPTITQVVLEELQSRIEAGFSPHLPIPYYRMENKKFKRYEL